MLSKLLQQYKLIFWDFDGVIKESIDVKTDAFVFLFKPFGSEVTEKIRVHHESNGGMSRYDKIPIYLTWAGLSPNPQLIDDFCNRFSSLVMQSVINAPWVKGVDFYLRNNPFQQQFVLITATPQNEIKNILTTLNLLSCFINVLGAPSSKMDAIGSTLQSQHVKPIDCLVIGDSKTDWDAASANKVPFLLRRHSTNILVFDQYSGQYFEDFSNISNNDF